MPMNSCEIGGPNKYCFPEDANAWRLITVKHPAIIKPLIGVASPHTLYVVPCRPPNSQAVALSEVLPSYRGYIYLPTPGDYYVNVPVQGSAATDTCFVVLDVGSPEGAVAMLTVLKEQQSLIVNTAGLIAQLADANADSDFSKADIGLLTNSRGAVWGEAAAEWRKTSGDPFSTIAGEAHGTYVYQRVAAGLLGRDTGDNTLRAIETRGALTQQGTALYRLLVDAAMRIYDINQGDYRVVAGTEDTLNGVVSFGGMVQGRDSGYYSTRRGRRFVATTEGATVTASNGFGATAPRFTLEAGATNELIVRKIELFCLAAGTTNLQFRVVLDPDARYSSGGTAGTVGARTNMNGGSSANGGYTFHYGGITATATDADEREIKYGMIVNVTGNKVTIEFEDGLVVPASGTLLIYIMDAGATGTVAINAEFEEANIQ